MDRSFVAYPSQSQQQQQQQASRRPKNDSFRPALRFPTDPHKPGSLPQKIQHIVAPAAPAAILLQSRRKPWEVDSTRLDDLVASTASLRKVIVVLGDAPTSALEPIVTSSYLSGCLVIVIASSDCDFTIAPQKCVPAVRVLRLRPQPAARPAPQKQSSQHQRAGSEAAAAESQPHFSASRLNAVLNWAERVGSAWRANPVGQTMFATLQEGEGPADGIGHGGGKHWNWRSKTKLTETAGYDLSDGDGSLVPWAARFALNSRSNTSSLASGGSSNTSSIFIVETPTSDTERPSFSSSSNGKFVRNAMSTSNLATSDRDRSFDHALAVTRRPGTSHAGHRSVPPPAKDLTPPTAQKRRFSLISFARGKMTPDIPISSKKAMRPSFDALINFLPPSSATGVDGVLGRGAIATNHAVASHNKLLLKQTILVTTAAQRFLVPVAPRGSGRSPGEGRFGGVTRGRASEGGSGMNGGGEDRQAKKRWSVAMIGSLFGVGDPVPSAKALGKRSALPTPPVSRPSSSEESGGKRPSLGGRMVSSVSAMSASTQGPYPLPKLVHVLPFGPGHASTPAGPGSARLVRNLEAFLLSWSFGGPKFAEEGDDSGAEGSATFSSNASGKRTVRPFLLDLAGMTDVLKAQLPDGDVEWPLADLILSGALDDEFPCTGGSPASTPSVPTPDVVVTRASSDARSPTGSNFPRTASGSKPKFGNDGLTLDSTPGPMEESWAARRAWLSGVGDLAIYPMAEGLGLTASSPTTTSGSGPSLRPTSTSTSISERSRTRSLGGATPARPRVSIGGVSSATSSPVASPQLQTPPPPVPSKIFAPSSSAPSTPAKSRTRIDSHGRSQSSSNTPPVPPLPPSPQETFGSAFGSPPPPSTFSGRSNFPSEQPRYARNPVPRPPQQSALDSEDRPARYYSVSDHGHGSPASSRSPPSQSSGADLRRGKSGTAASAASPSMSATPIAAAFSRMRDQDEFGSAPPPPTSWNGTWGSASSAPSYQAPSPSASLPSRSSIKNSDYASQISHGRNPPTRGTTVPQSGGSWDLDSSDVASPRPSVLRKKSIDDRDRRYGANTPPAPHPAFTSSPKYPGIGRRPSEDKQPYFTGYEIAPPPLPLPTPTPPRPTRAAPPNTGGKLERNRSTSSPLRNGVSAEGLNNHRPRPGTGGSVIDKRLPITPPDSASSSEVSNDMDGRTSDREEKRRWWASPTKVSARLI